MKNIETREGVYRFGGYGIRSGEDNLLQVSVFRHPS